MPDETASRIVATGVPYAQIPHSCTLDPNVTNTAYRVYGLLMKLANSTGRAWPGQRYIADVLPMTRPTAKAALDNLESSGWITVDREKQAHQYFIHGENNQLPFTTGKESWPVKNLGRTGKETIHEPVKKLGPIENQDRQPEPTTTLAPKTAHDTMVYALLDALEWNRADVTETEWGKLHAAAKQLTDIDADPNEAAYRAQVYRVNRRGASISPHAIATNWAELSQPRVPLTVAQVEKASNRQRRQQALEAL